MHGSGSSRGRLVQVAAGIALGAALVLVTWIVAGGQPFGRIVGSDDVSAPTSAAGKASTVKRRADAPAKRSVRLASRPPALVRAPELRFIKPGRNPAKKAGRPRRAVRSKRAKRARRAPVVRVAAPPSEAATGAPVQRAAPPAPPAAPAPPAP